METVTQLRLLGTVQVEQDGEPVRGFRSRKALAVLSYLVVQDQSIPREQLVDLFWGDQTESRGRANLSWVLNHISTHLPGCLETDRHSVRFRRSVSRWIDVDAFEELESQGDPGALAAAVELYRGEFLEGLYLEGCPEYEIWVVGERERWRQMVAQALGALVAHHSARGEYIQGLRFAQHLLMLEPWREETHRQTMRLLARSGQHSAALAQYEACRQVLAQELNVEPAEATTTLYERIRAAASMRRHNLPPKSTPFIGREDELPHITGLLDNPDCRLLTIVGPGGIGKTRLALQAAAARVESFLEGVCFVPLAAVGSAEFLVSAISDALQLPPAQSRDPQVHLLNFLHGKEVLLVLDSFEHLLEGTTLLVDVLQRAPEVKLLVTSRECLNLRSEWRFEIQGLTYPADGGDGTDDVEKLADYSAVQLFLQTALRARPSFSLSTRDRSAIMRICRLVEGMPLGLELAAALVKTRTCDQIAREIEHSLDSLATTFRDMPKRQRSLRATFDHSWRLLTPAEQGALAQLSVFRGGFKAEAANDVADAVVDTLESLESKSLLRFAPTGRFEMHELARQYAAEKLAATSGTEEKTRARHSAYYTTFLQLREADLAGVGAAQAIAVIGAEMANVRAAWRWAVTHAQIEAIERGLDGLSRFLLLAGLYQEGEVLTKMTVDRLRALVEEADKPELALRIVLGRALAEWARFLNRVGVYDRAITAAREAIDLARVEQVTSVEAAACLQWGQALWRQGAFDAAQTQLEEALSVAQAVSSRQVEADSLRLLGNVSHSRGAFTEARARFEQALPIYREIGDGRGEGGTLNNLGAVCLELGDNTGATGYYEQVLDIYRQIGDRQIGGAALNNLARVSMRQGAYSQSIAYFEQALQIWRDVGDRQGEGWGLLNLSFVGREQNDYAAATVRCEQALRAFCDVGDRRGEGWGLLNLGCIALEQNDYTTASDRCEQALRVFRDIGERQGEGNALIHIGAVLHRQGFYAKAKARLEQALLICREIRDRQGECWALGHFGSLSIECGAYAKAQDSFEQALCLCQEIGDRKGEGEGQAGLCLLFHLLGDDGAALEHGQQALLIAQKLGDRSSECCYLNRLGYALVGLGRLTEAAEMYQRALELGRELGVRGLAVESLAGLARVAVTQGNLALAQSHVDEILADLEDNSLEGADEPFQVYLTCYRVLRGNKDPRAQEILATAYGLLQGRAAKIGDDDLRRSFLDSVATHRGIVEEVECSSVD